VERGHSGLLTCRAGQDAEAVSGIVTRGSGAGVPACRTEASLIAVAAIVNRADSTRKRGPGGPAGHRPDPECHLRSPRKGGFSGTMRKAWVMGPTQEPLPACGAAS